MSQVDAYCKGCQYLGTNFYGKWCRYNDVTGHTRGCPAGTGCDKYAAGPTKCVPNAAIYEHKIPEKKPKPAPTQPPKKEKKPPLTQEEIYEREKNRKREAAVRLREKAQGRQRAAIAAYKQATGDSNYQISLKIGVSESSVAKWANEYAPANWGKLAILGIEKPTGL